MRHSNDEMARSEGNAFAQRDDELDLLRAEACRALDKGVADESFAWEQFFLHFFDEVAGALTVVLRASGCREGWLQGELFRAGYSKGLQVNCFSLGKGQKADLCCLRSPRMIAELKVLGADHFSKMRFALDSDALRLSKVPGDDLERYLILVIPKCDVKTPLGDYLHSVTYSTKCIERDYSSFSLRLWRLEKAS